MRRKRIQWAVFTGVIALSLFSFVFIHSSAQPFNLQQNAQQQTELAVPDANESDSKISLPESKIIQFVANRLTSAFSSIVNKD